MGAVVCISVSLDLHRECPDTQTNGPATDLSSFKSYAAGFGGRHTVLIHGLGQFGEDQSSQRPNHAITTKLASHIIVCLTIEDRIFLADYNLGWLKTTRNSNAREHPVSVRSPPEWKMPSLSHRYST